MTVTWRQVLNQLQNLSPEQLNQSVQIVDADGDSTHVSGMRMEMFILNGETVIFPVLEA